MTLTALMPRNVARSISVSLATPLPARKTARARLTENPREAIPSFYIGSILAGAASPERRAHARYNEEIHMAAKEKPPKEPMPPINVWLAPVALGWLVP